MYVWARRLLFTAVLTINTTSAWGQKLYWTEAGAIRRANTDGSFLETLAVARYFYPQQIAIDEFKTTFYVIGGYAIYRDSLDGSDLEPVVWGLYYPRGIALDTVNSKVYWSDVGYGHIRRANLDGTEIESVIEGIRPEAIAIDPLDGFVYWTDTQSIRRCDFDGENLETLVPGLISPMGIAFDPVSRAIYWSDRYLQKIQRRDPRTHVVEDVITTNGNRLDKIALDLSKRQLYWVEAASTLMETTRIRRATLDGSRTETVIELGLNGVDGIAIDTLRGDIYWADTWLREVWRANSTGNRVEPIVKRTIQAPTGIALDPLTGKLHWVDPETGKIQRSNLDGSSIEDILLPDDRAWGPLGFALDSTKQRMYWTMPGTHSIHRSNMDGSSIETLFESALGIPRWLALDLVHDRMYWTDTETRAVMSSALDGADPTTVATGNLPYAIAVDEAGEHIFWSDYDGLGPSPSGVIWRADLRGMQPELFLNTHEFGAIHDIIIDSAARVLYWCAGYLNTGSIHRATLDGKSIEPVFETGLDQPESLALDLRVPGDFNLSGRVDLRDFGVLQTCFTGNGPASVAPPCIFFDSDPADRDVDADDFSAFKTSLRGP